jgi:hypothetical protein
MKLLFILPFLVSCDLFQKGWVNRIKLESKKYCSCHGGIQYLTFNDFTLDLMCKDGQQHKVTGNIAQHFIVGCEK